MEAEASRSSSSGSADSYIGSLISLTSKSEIRYEGILFNINTEESNIGLRNVRSFGTEGRKKDGPQVPPSDKVYEYILFRGSDIKDLQVKSSPPIQASTPIHNDPAIIQSHYPQAAIASASLPSSGAGHVLDHNSHTSQTGLPRSTFQGTLPLYQPGGNLGSWGSSSLPTTNGNGLAAPAYWQGFYGPSNGLQGQQQSLLRPPFGMSLPPSMQQSLQYPATSVSLPTGASNFPAPQFSVPPPLLPPFSTSTLNSHSSMLPVQSSASVSDLPSNLVPHNIPNQALSTSSLSNNLPLVSPLTTVPDMSAIAPPFSSEPKIDFSSIMPYSEPMSSVVASSSLILKEGATPSLVTPGQLLQSGPITASPSLSSHTAQKDIEVVEVLSSGPLPPASTDSQAPILPLPSPLHRKLNEAPSQMRHNNRGRERGRGYGVSRPLTRFTDDFDFMAMNEKFNKDEVWGHLGKKALEDEDDSQDEDNAGSSKFETKPVYVKDDFFDSLSCNSLDRGSQNGRGARFSERLKIDTETFGDIPRHRGFRGGRGPGRGGGRSHGGYYGRGYGYGYGYGGQGRGYNMSSRGAYS